MLTNYFKFAWRRLMADKQTSFINLFGLTVALVGFLLIVQYVFYEKSYDGFYKRKEDIYKIGVEIYRDNKLNIRSAINYAGVGPALKAELPEVETYLRMLRVGSTVEIGTRRFRENDLFLADASFFEIFSIPLSEGDAATVLKEPNSVVISSSIAKKYFGDAHCAGKIIHCENYFPGKEFKVTGVFEDLPQNTHLACDMLLSWSSYDNPPGHIQPWQWRDYHTYIMLKEHSDASSFVRKITALDFVNKRNSGFDRLNMRHALIPERLTDIYLRSDLVHEMKVPGNGQMLKFLLLIAFFVLGMAWMNYVNLSTAMATKRMKEIGIRKTIGAQKKNLIMQFLAEAFVLNGMALLLSLILVNLIKPYFNSFTGKYISMPWLTWAGSFLFVLLAILASVWYPASVLSRFSPLKALKNEKFSSSKGGLLRKSLIVFQFSISTVLIICTVIVLMQLRHMQKAPLGLNIDQTVVVRAPLPNDTVAYAGYLVFKEKLLRNPLIRNATASHVVPGDESEWTPGLRKLTEDNGAPGQSITCVANAIEPDFIKQYDLPIKIGRGLSKEFGTDERSILLTETACEKLNYSKPVDAINQRLIIVGDTFTVVGITGDFRHYGMKYAPLPYVFFQKKDEYRKYSVKISGNDVAGAIDFIQKTYSEIFPRSSFEFVFADELYGKQYDSEKKTAVIVSIFTILAIIIACLGLFGLTVFITRQKIKEISVRKVLGASVASIVQLLSKDFLKLVVAAIVIAIPVSWWAMHKWLQTFAYRVEITWWLPALAGIFAIFIALITVSFQAIKAAVTNPVNNLRSE